MATAGIFSSSSSSSSFFTSNSYFKRPMSFGGEDSLQTTGSIFDVEKPIPGAMETEKGGSPTAADPAQESKRARKLVPRASLAVAALCCGTYASIPAPVQPHPHLSPSYRTLLALISMGVFTSLGLFTYSLVRPGGAEVVWVRKKVAAIAIAFFLTVSVLRISLYLPVASLGHACLPFFLVTAAIALYLYYTAWKRESYNHAAGEPDDHVPI